MRPAQVEEHQGRPRVLDTPVIPNVRQELAVVVTVLEFGIETDGPFTQYAAKVRRGQVVQRQIKAVRHAAVGGRQKLLQGGEVVSRDRRPRPFTTNYLEDSLMLALAVDAVEHAWRRHRPKDLV